MRDDDDMRPSRMTRDLRREALLQGVPPSRVNLALEELDRWLLQTMTTSELNGLRADAPQVRDFLKEVARHMCPTPTDLAS